MSFNLIRIILLSLIYLLPLSLLSADNENSFISESRQLIYEGKRSGEGYFSNDGRYLVFQSEREEDNPFYQIYILDFESGDIHRVSPGTGKTTCAYFQGGENDRVLFSSTHLDPEAEKKQKEEFELRESGKKRRYSWDYDRTMDVFTSDFDGSNLKRLTEAEGYDAEASYSPDGSKIVFSSNRTAYEKELSDKEKKQLEIDPAYFCELYIMDSDGNNLKRLTNTPGYDGGPFFSPDGKKIVWRRFTEDGHLADIYTMDTNGSNIKKITDFNSMSWAPYFHPSGEYIIFASNKYGFDNFELFLVDSKGKKLPVRVTELDGFDGLPVFHPNGEKLVWTSNRTSTEKAQLFIGKWDHQAALKAIENAPMRVFEDSIEFTGDITEEDISAKAYYLSSEELEGRMTGSKGIKLAANYIVSNFNEFDLQPLSEFDVFRIPFKYISEIKVNEKDNKLSVGDKEFKLNQDFVPLAPTSNEKFDAKAMFVGFGIKTPAENEFSYNSFDGVDVSDKILLMLDDMPTGLSDENKKHLQRYSNRMYKVLTARDLGAKGIIFITERETLRKPRARGLNINAGMPLMEINKETASKITCKDFNKIIAEINEYNPHAQHAFSLKNNIKGKIKVEKIYSNDNNIVGMVPGYNSDEYIVIGGHYDHLGYGETGSLIGGEAGEKIHNGADDNASGTALVMELAEYYSEKYKNDPESIKKNLVFALWSGEELGLLGSSEFLDNIKDKNLKIHSYLNYDMVGMLEENKLNVQGIGSAENWKKIFEKKNIVAGFDLSMQEDPYLPTDAASFYNHKVPVASFFTGLHDHYHKPSDDYEILNTKGIQRIAKFSSMVIDELMKEEVDISYKKVEMNRQKNVRGFSVYLGTIPDYTAEVEGVKLSGVRAGGPADKAGIKGDDILIELAGKEIKNIYDYTNILADLKPGKSYIVKIERAGNIKNLEIVPESK